MKISKEKQFISTAMISPRNTAKSFQDKIPSVFTLHYLNYHDSSAVPVNCKTSVLKLKIFSVKNSSMNKKETVNRFGFLLFFFKGKIQVGTDISISFDNKSSLLVLINIMLRNDRNERFFFQFEIITIASTDPRCIFQISII